MTSEAPRRYRFAAFRRPGLFGNVPPSLLITLAIRGLAGWGGVPGAGCCGRPTGPRAPAGATPGGTAAPAVPGPPPGPP